VKEYDGKLRVVFKNMVVHPPVTVAHNAACAASRQGKFVEFKRAWWDKGWKAYGENRGDMTKVEPVIYEIAHDLKLDEAKFKADMAGPECKARVQGDAQELSKWHVNSTPTFYVNGHHLEWDGSPGSFKAAIDEAQKIAQASGVPCGDYYEKKIMGEGLKQFRSKAEAGGK
jgi:protein-disulfide isomerase